MNKTFKRLLVAVLALSATQLNAHTNQTYLNARSHGVNVAMDQTVGWEARGAKEDAFGGTLQVTGFYTDSGDKTGLGKYFLYGNTASSTLASNEWTNVLNASAGVALDATTLTIGLRPSQSAYGVALSYHQKLDKILHGLYFDVKLPVVRVENDLGLSTGGANAAAAAQLQKVLNGTLAAIPAGTAGARVGLTNAIMGGKRNATGVADIDLMLGYSFLRKEKYNASLNLGVTIPTGNKADGKYAWQPIYGNGNHFAFGAGLEGCARVWGDHHTNVKLHGALNFRYLFETTEKRTLGINAGGDLSSDFTQYNLLLNGTNRAAVINTLQLTPAANVTTLNVGVTPGSQLDGLVALSYNRGGLTLDLGYNLYYREDESVKSKYTYTDGSWLLVTGNPTTARIGGAGMNAGQILMTSNNAADTLTGLLATAGDAAVPLTNAMLNLNSARTPSQFSNKIYGSVGYLFRNCEYPVLVGAGAHYEFASSNSVVENWGIQGKVGITF